MAFGVPVSRIIYADAKFDIRNGIYAHPLTGIFNASNKDPVTAPQNEICSNIVFISAIIA